MCGNNFKWIYDFFCGKNQEILNRVLDSALTISLLSKYFTPDISITDEDVTKQTGWLEWLIPLSSTEHASQTIYPVVYSYFIIKNVY